MEPCLLLEHKGDEPFRAPHIVLIALPQMLLEDMLFHPDTIAKTEKSTSYDDEEVNQLFVKLSPNPSNVMRMPV